MPAPSHRSRYDRAAVVIPAHNEGAELPACLRAVVTAALCTPIPVTILVVLDASDDSSTELSGRFGSDVHFLSIDARNVGAARAAGFDYARALCGNNTECWYATTDADSQVDPDWLVHQLAHDTDMVLGVVRAVDWHHLSAAIANRYVRAYNASKPGVQGSHRHIHGANMGFSARAYWRLGGFRALPYDEDVELVARFEAAGCSIQRDAGLSVMTSTRTEARAPRGFGHYLRQLAVSVDEDCA
jgi:glycosyltransferase involved in cell wall biosynthesis